MHSTVMVAIAAERHSELLRDAALRRRAGLARRTRPASTGSLTRPVRDLWSELTGLGAGRTDPQLCCA